MKRALAFLLALILVTTMTGTIYAANTPTPTLAKQMEGGIGNVLIYIDGNSTPRATYWERLIANAVNNWMYTGHGANPFYASYISSNNGSKIDFYALYDSSFDHPADGKILAQTMFYTRSGVSVNPNTSNWFYAVISINHTELSKDKYTNAQATGTFAHEIGHALGLGHNNTNQNSIMCQTGYNRLVQTVQKVDNDALNRKY